MRINDFTALHTRCILRAIITGFVLLIANLQAQGTIDSIVYNRGTFFGTSTNDAYLLHMAVDAQGYVYGTGLCRSIPTTPGAYRTTNQGGVYDVMIFKMDPTMKTLIWATYVGGSGVDAGGGIAVNSSGEVYVAGYTLSSNFPVTVSSDATYLASNVVNYFALKLSADGSTLLYSRILGRGSAVTQQTASASKGAHVAINPSGEAFVFSHTNSSLYQITGNAYQGSLAGSSDFVLTKLGSTGSVLYSTYFGGSAAETSYDICYANGKVYCTGTTASAGISLRSGKVPDAVGDCCVFVADDGSTCPPRKCYVYGTSASDRGYAVWYDTRAHRVCVTGTMGTTPPAPFTSLQTGQNSGGFIGAVDTALNSTLFTTTIGTSVIPTSVVTRSTNSTAYVAGYLTSGTVPVTVNGFQQTPRGSLDGFMISVDSAGSFLKYGTYMGGSGEDYSAAKVLLVDRGCLLRVIFGITTHSTNFPSTTNTYQPLKLNGVDDQPALAMFATTPTASLTSSGKPCSREATLTFTTSCPISSLRWSFGDNTQASGGNPIVHVYPGIGIYKVIATAVTTEGDTIVKTQDIAIGSANPIDAGPDRTICKNQSTLLVASGAVSYSWSPGGTLSDSTISNPVARPTKNTMYYVRGRDAFGCESYDSVFVVIREIKATVSADTTICEGSVVQLAATGGTYYSWSPTTGLSSPNNPVVLARPQTSTTYTLVAYDGICFDTQRVTINVIPKPKLSFAPVPGICANTPVELRVFVDARGAIDSTIMSYSWFPASGVINPTSANPIVTPSKDSWYKVMVTMRNGCIVTDSIRVPIQSKLRITVSSDTALCSGGSVTLRANGATQYSWSPRDGLNDSTLASPACTPQKTTTYRVIGKSGACIDTQSVTITVRERPRSLQAFGDTTVCTNERVRLSATSLDTTGVTYSWFPRADFENPDGAVVYARSAVSRTYVVVATTMYGCTGTDSVRVTVDNALEVQGGPNVTACAGENVQLRILSKHDSLTTFSWTPNDGIWDKNTNTYTVTANASKTYKVVLQRGSCTGEVEMTVTAKPQPQFTVSADTSVCEGQSVRPFASSLQSGISYRWLVNGIPDSALDNPFSSRPVLRSLRSDRVWTVEANVDGCIQQKEVRAHVYALPDSIPTLDTAICDGEYAVLSIPSTTPATYTWDPPAGLSATTGPRVVANPAATSSYTITAVSPEGCIRTARVRVDVRRRITFSYGIEPVNDGKVHLPGDTASIVVYAFADSSIQRPLRLDVAINSGILQVFSHPFTDVSGRRYVRVELPSFDYTAQKMPVAIIKGKVLQSSPAYSTISIENIGQDSALCPIVTTTPSLLSITSCFSRGRNVELIEPLQVAVQPNPADHSARLSIRTSERGVAVVELYNAVGMLVSVHHAELDGTGANGTLQLEELPSGLYTMVVRTPEQFAYTHVVKR
jgi:hypothetical protein